jgi:hypothetical protein
MCSKETTVGFEPTKSRFAGVRFRPLSHVVLVLVALDPAADLLV